MMKRFDLMQKLLHGKYIFTAAAFLLIVLLGMPASAASFKNITVGSGTQSFRSKVGSLYFWGGFDEGKSGYSLYTSQSKTGEGKALTELHPWDSALNIITDGKTVIYPNYLGSKTTVSMINVDGTGKKTIAKIKTYGYQHMDILKQYKSKVYYSAADALFCINQKTGENTKIAEGHGLSAAADKSSKYIYAVIPKSRSIVVKIINSHSTEVKGTQKTAVGKGYELTHVFATKKYLYFTTLNSKRNTADFFRMPAAGKKGIKHIGRLKSPGKSTEYSGAVYVINDKYACFSVYDDAKEENLYYKYTFANKKISKISDRVYDKNTRKLWDY